MPAHLCLAREEGQSFPGWKWLQQRMTLIPFRGKKPQVSPGAFVAPTATLVGDVIVEEGASIWFGAVLRADIGSIVVKKGASVQDNAVAHLKLQNSRVYIGENATIAHGAILHDCTVEKGAVVGIGAVVLDFAVVGEDAVVAAGSVVAQNTKIPPRHLAVGIPAKVKKELSGASLIYVQQGHQIYFKLRDEYLAQDIGRIE